MIKPLNYRIAAHPINWIIVILMLIIAGAFGHLTLSLFGMEAANQHSQSEYTQLPAGQAPRTTTVS